MDKPCIVMLGRPGEGHVAYWFVPAATIDAMLEAWPAPHGEMLFDDPDGLLAATQEALQAHSVHIQHTESASE